MKGNILFIDRGQFGQLVDTLAYCQHLNTDYNIEYLCFEDNYPHINIPNVKVTYVTTKYKSKMSRGVKFVISVILKCIRYNGVIFLVYFPGCAIVKRLLFWKKIHVDVRTLSVAYDQRIRSKEDRQLNKAINYFDSISCISEGVKNKLNYKKNIPMFILPLGADELSNKDKDFSELKLLYVGTLSNRNIKQTVVGVKMFLNKHPDQHLVYHIIGDGDEYSLIHEYIKKNELAGNVILHGRIPHSQLSQYFDNCNIGISYIPITEYYEFQPPTKTFEYILSGLFCIATQTLANCEVVNKSNGILIQDTSDAFCKALEDVCDMRQILDSKKIRKSQKNYLWSNLIDEYLIPIIKQY